MKCPVDGAQLAIADRQGIEIDYCPDCRGVWLDRGELDKLIERSADQGSGRDRDDRPEPRYREERRDYDKPHYKKKKKSFLGEIFEFGD